MSWVLCKNLKFLPHHHVSYMGTWMKRLTQYQLYSTMASGLNHVPHFCQILAWVYTQSAYISIDIFCNWGFHPCPHCFSHTHIKVFVVAAAILYQQQKLAINTIRRYFYFNAFITHLQIKKVKPLISIIGIIIVKYFSRI